jgi:hypothetical protein
MRHQDQANGEAVSTEGDSVMTPSNDHTARVNSAATGQLLTDPQ